MTNHRMIAELPGELAQARTPTPSVRPDSDGIFQMRITVLPEFRFEWHPRERRVYFIRIGATPEIAEPLCDGIINTLDARQALVVWGRGYLEGKAFRLGNPQPE